MRSKTYLVVDGPGALALWLKQRNLNLCKTLCFTLEKTKLKSSVNSIKFEVSNAQYTSSGHIYTITGIHSDSGGICQVFVLLYDTKTKRGTMKISPSLARD